jgi:hypothetical protein
MNKRIRFGLIFVGPKPASDGGFLRELGIRQIEGCSLGNKHYVIFTVERPKKASDILDAVGVQNRANSRGASTELEEELMRASDGVLMDGATTIVLMPVGSDNETAAASGGKGAAASSSSSKSSLPAKQSFVAVFDKGHAFQSHEIFRMICSAKLSHMQVRAPPAVNEYGNPLPASAEEPAQPSGYWSWSAPGVPDPSGSGKKRAVSELASDLVETSIKPSSSKRVSLASGSKESMSDIEGEVFGTSGGGVVFVAPDPVAEQDESGAPSAPTAVMQDEGLDEGAGVFEMQVRWRVAAFARFVVHAPSSLTAFDDRVGAHRPRPVRHPRRRTMVLRRRVGRRPPVARPQRLVVVRVAVVGRRAKRVGGAPLRRL